ncbi:MAG: sigma-70 family RNA polymerase sigma factor [Bacteroidota bacterium]
MNDAEIIRILCQDEDKGGQVLESVISRYKNPIKRILISMGNIDWQAADDHYQEALIAFWKSASECMLTEETEIFKFLKKVSTRRLYDQFREKRYSTTSSSGLEAIRLPQPSTPETVLMNEEDEILVKEIIDQWTGDCKEYFDLQKELKTAELYETLGFDSSKQASDKWYRCKQDLFKIVIKDPTYRSYVSEQLLVDVEIRKLLWQYQDELDPIWLYIKKKLPKAEMQAYEERASQEEGLEKVISLMKKRSGTRRLFPFPPLSVAPTVAEIDKIVEPLLSLYSQLMTQLQYEEHQQEPWLTIDWTRDSF